MIEIKCVTKDSELEAIQALQRANLRKNLSETEATEEGFLIAETRHHIRGSRQPTVPASSFENWF